MCWIVRILSLAGPLCRKFRRYGLTQHKTTRTPDKCDTRCVGAGSIILMYWRAVCRRHVSRINDVFNADRHSMDQAIGRAIIEDFSGESLIKSIDVLPPINDCDFPIPIHR